MPLTIEAIFEDGVLKPTEPLPLAEHERVQVTIHAEPSLARQTAGLLTWKGDVDLLERIACDPEFGILESP